MDLFMWGVLWMYAVDGHRLRRPVLTKNNGNKHFCDGCPNNTGDLSHLRWTLVDHIQITEEQLTNVGHQGGAKCRCSECIRLKTVEDKWICRLGSFYGGGGLNTRDEIKARSRVNFVGSSSI